VLIDQTTLCEAARLLEGTGTPRNWIPGVPWSPPGTAERLIHLSTLLDAVLLYDELHVLDAQLPRDADALTLRQVLLDRGILRHVDTRALSTDVAHELTGFLRDAETNAPQVATSLIPVSAWEVGHNVRRLLAHHRPSVDVIGRSDQMLWLTIRNEIEANIAYISPTAPLRSDPLQTLGAETLLRIGYFSSGAVDIGISHLRTFIYWRTSAHLRIPFLPSLHRLPVYHLMTDHVRRTVQDRVYGVVADAFRTAVGEVYEGEEPVPLYLPPALSLFLDHLRAHGDIAAAVDDLRRRHHKLRRALTELQQTLDSSSTLGEARAARRRLNAVLEALRTDLAPGDQAAVGTVDQLIDIVPSVTKMAANPLDVDGYAEALLARPADWIRSWWLRRPVRSALRLSTRLENLSRYDRILEEATGQQCDPADTEELRHQYGAALDLYGGDSRLPATPRRPTGERPEQEPA
jgi:hypothetical protein